MKENIVSTSASVENQWMFPKVKKRFSDSRMSGMLCHGTPTGGFSRRIFKDVCVGPPQSHARDVSPVLRVRNTENTNKFEARNFLRSEHNSREKPHIFISNSLNWILLWLLEQRNELTKWLWGEHLNCFSCLWIIIIGKIPADFNAAIVLFWIHFQESKINIPTSRCNAL